MPRIAACAAPWRWPGSSAISSLLRGAGGAAAGRGRRGRRPRRATRRSAAVGGGDGGAVAQAGDVADRGAGGEHVERLGLGGDVEGALGGGDDHPPGRGGVDAASASPCLAQNVAGVVELVGRLEGERLDALEGALGDAGERAGRRHLEDAGDAEVVHRLQAEVPADRAGDLADDPREHLAAVVDRPGRRGWRSPGCAGRGPTPTGRARRGGRRRAPCAAVWKAPATLSGISRALVGRVVGEGLRAARGCRRRRSGRGRCRWRR